MTLPRSRLRAFLLGALPFVAVLVLWQVAPAIFHYPAYLFPTVAEVFRRFADIVISGELARAVLASLGRGLSNLEIAAELAITEATTKTHVSRVLAKLGLRSRVQAAIAAQDAGLAGP